MAGDFKNQQNLYKEIIRCKNGTFFNKDNLLNLIKNDENLKDQCILSHHCTAEHHFCFGPATSSFLEL